MSKRNWNTPYKETMITIDYELQDIVIYALRYAIGRKTYVTSEVCEFIMQHSNLIDDRVKTIMLRDLENLNEYYKIDDIDYLQFDTLRKWLNLINVDTEVEK